MVECIYVVLAAACARVFSGSGPRGIGKRLESSGRALVLIRFNMYLFVGGLGSGVLRKSTGKYSGRNDCSLRVPSRLRTGQVSLSPTVLTSMNAGNPGLAPIIELREMIASLVLFDSFRRPAEMKNFPTLLVEFLDLLLAEKYILATEAYTRLWVSVCGDRGRGWYEEVVALLYHCGGGNPFTKIVFSHGGIPDHVKPVASSDLAILEKLAKFDISELRKCTGSKHLPDLARETGFRDTLPDSVDKLLDKFRLGNDWTANVDELAEVIRMVGVGITGEYYGLAYFDGMLEGVVSREETLTAEATRFVGVENLQAQVNYNTECFLKGHKAQNVLLYGPPGSGKSSLIRSLLKEFGEHGLRLVEVKKRDLRHLQSVVSQLSKMPENFIVFVDDLSYNEYETEELREGKAALEGSLRGDCENVIIYATSNRRHPGITSIHDETEEKMAFSQRFGLTLEFPDTDREQYDAIVVQLGKDAGIDLPTGELKRRALLFAFGNTSLRNANGLSGRTARQFIDYMIADDALRADGHTGVIDWRLTAATPWYASMLDDE